MGLLLVEFETRIGFEPDERADQLQPNMDCYAHFLILALF